MTYDRAQPFTVAMTSYDTACDVTIGNWVRASNTICQIQRLTMYAIYFYSYLRLGDESHATAWRHICRNHICNPEQKVFFQNRETKSRKKNCSGDESHATATEGEELEEEDREDDRRLREMRRLEIRHMAPPVFPDTTDSDTEVRFFIYNIYNFYLFTEVDFLSAKKLLKIIIIHWILHYNKIQWSLNSNK